ncbi:hypothetical protein DQP58_14520 [Mycobacterium colombiense]|uniref:Uncharacterized protein n=1 Tax=Mycobacterium colombiense TaxID=339268 RepID=A0A329KGC9_9MYCO|nr:hypothetical protein DQP58_14520 [Mycobacterium colombiense]
MAQPAADHVVAWQDAGGRRVRERGSTLPQRTTTFIDQVVPILQRGGRFRTECSGSTLRDHRGLERPAKRSVP